MKLLQDLLEALKPSEYRQYVKEWDKSKYEALFRKYANDKKAYRIYIPLKGEPKQVDPDPEVEAAVKSAGYVIEDYITGIASKDEGKRKIKIGKLLRDPKLQQKFANDPKRASAKNVENFVVISRHPYDLAGMSTDRGWRSCMNIHDGINRHYVPIDIKEGTLVAYLVRADDKNINNPIARVLIKTFVNVDGNAPEDKRVAFGIEDRVYGTPMSGFTQTVAKWVEEVNDSKGLDGIFEFNDNLYNDGGTKDKIGVGPTGKAYQMVKDDWKNIQKFENPSPAVVDLAMKRSHGAAVMYMKNPSHEDVEKAFKNIYWSYYNHQENEANVKDMIKRAIDLNMFTPKARENLLYRIPQAIAFIPHVSDEELMKAVEHDMGVLKYVDNPSEAVIKHALGVDYTALRFLKAPPSDDVIIYAIDHAVSLSKGHYTSKSQLIARVLDGLSHHDDWKPSSKILHHAIDHDHEVVDYVNRDWIDDSHAEKLFEKKPKYLKYLKNPTQEQIDKALDYDPDQIQFVKKPTEDQLMKVVEKSPESLGLIPDAVEVPQSVYDRAVEKDPKVVRYVPKDKQTEAMHHKLLDHNEKQDEWSHVMGRSYLSNPSHAVMLRAVMQHPRWIRHFDNPPEDVQMAAIKKDPKMVAQVKDPSEDVLTAALEKMKEGDFWDAFHRATFFTEKTMMLAVKKFGGKAITVVSEHYGYDDEDGLSEKVRSILTDDVIREAMKTYGKALYYLKKPTVEDIASAIKKDHLLIRSMTSKHRELLTKEQKIEILKKDGALLDYFPESDLQDLDIMKAAIKSYPYAIEFAFYNEGNKDQKPIPESLQLLAINNKKVGPEGDYDVSNIVSRIGWRSLTPKVAKLAVEKSHHAIRQVKLTIGDIPKKQRESRGFTADFMAEITGIAATNKKVHTDKMKNVRKLAEVVRVRRHLAHNKKDAVLEKQADEFIKANPKNFKGKVDSNHFGSILREIAFDMAYEWKLEADTCIIHYYYGEDGNGKQQTYAVFFKKKEPVAWIKDDQTAFIPGAETKKKERLKESWFTTFKMVLNGKPDETE